MNRFLLAVPVALGLFIGGCTADSTEAVSSDESAATAAEAITLANYVSHPKIRQIRAEVVAIDAAGYTEKTNPGCDGHNIKFTDRSGNIRKVVSEGGEGDGSGSVTGYYRDNGKLAFLFFTFTGANGMGGVTTSQSRVYFDANGRAFWQVSREASSPNSNEPDIASAPDFITPADASYVNDDGHEATYEDAAKWFASTGCGQP